MIFLSNCLDRQADAELSNKLMRGRVASCICALALLASLGGHWGILQSIAWANMFVDFSSETTVGAALKKTFDSENACDMCKLVKKGKRQDEERQSVLKIDQKLWCVVSSPSICVFGVRVEQDDETSSTVASQMSPAPPSQPPRIG